MRPEKAKQQLKEKKNRSEKQSAVATTMANLIESQEGLLKAFRSNEIHKKIHALHLQYKIHRKTNPSKADKIKMQLDQLVEVAVNQSDDNNDETTDSVRPHAEEVPTNTTVLKEATNTVPESIIMKEPPPRSEDNNLSTKAIVVNNPTDDTENLQANMNNGTEEWPEYTNRRIAIGYTTAPTSVVPNFSNHGYLFQDSWNPGVIGNNKSDTHSFPNNFNYRM